MRKKVIMACIHPYSSVYQVGSQHIARQFIKNGYDVAYISSPLSPFHILKRPDKELFDRFEIYRRGGEYCCNNRLWQYVPFSLITPVNKPLLGSEYVVNKWKNMCLPNLTQKLKLKGYDKVDVFYFDNPLAFPLLENVNCRTSVFRIMDMHSGFPNYPKVFKTLIKKIQGSVDLVVYSAKLLKSYAKQFTNKREPLHMPNGIDFDSFTEGSRQVPGAIRHISKPIAVYVGSLETWFDFELVAFAAMKLPEISFLIIGPRNNHSQQLQKLENVHMIGAVDHKMLQAYLYNCKVGIIPFNIRRYPELINSVNPLKLYEYMACGLPVVAMEWDEIKSLRSPALLCKTREKFVEAISKTAQIQVDKNIFINYAKKNSWENSFLNVFKEIQTIQSG